MGRLCYYLPKENKSNKKRKKDYYEQEVKMDAHTKGIPPWRYPIKVLLILNWAQVFFGLLAPKILRHRSAKTAIKY